MPIVAVNSRFVVLPDSPDGGLVLGAAEPSPEVLAGELRALCGGKSHASEARLLPGILRLFAATGLDSEQKACAALNLARVAQFPDYFLQSYQQAYESLSDRSPDDRVRLLNHVVMEGAEVPEHALHNIAAISTHFPESERGAVVEGVWSRLGPERFNWGLRQVRNIAAMMPPPQAAERALAALDTALDAVGSLRRRRLARYPEFRDRTYGYNQLEEFLAAAAEKAVSFEVAADFLAAAEDHEWGREEALFSVASSLLRCSDAPGAVSVLRDFMRIVGRLNRHNVKPACRLFLDENRVRTFAEVGGAATVSVVSLLAEVFERWPRAALAVSGGILEGLRDGSLPADLDAPFRNGDSRPLRRAVIDFVERAHGFLPPIFAAYREHGEEIFQTLERFLPAILCGNFGLAEVDAIRNRYGETFLLGLCQLVSPPSGMSASSNDHQMKVMRAFLAKGDLRTHVPDGLRGRVREFALTRGCFRLKAGETADPDGRLKTLLARFRPGDGSERVRAAGLAAAYFGTEAPPPGTLTELYGAFYSWVAADPAFAPSFEKMKVLDYEGVNVLREWFTDPDLLPKRLGELLAELPDSVLRRHAESSPAVAEKLRRRLLAKPLSLIQKELDRYEYAEEETARLGLCSDKSPAFALWGFTAAVCTGGNEDLWADPNFWLMPILAFPDGTPPRFEAVGYTQIYRTVLEGRPHFIVIAIDPSVEFMATADAEALYDAVLAQIKTDAAALGYRKIHIPKSHGIHSNRGEMSLAIRKKKYPVVKLPPVRWLRGEGGISVFTEAFEIEL